KKRPASASLLYKQLTSMQSYTAELRAHFYKQTGLISIIDEHQFFQAEVLMFHESCIHFGRIIQLSDDSRQPAFQCAALRNAQVDAAHVGIDRRRLGRVLQCQIY